MSIASSPERPHLPSGQRTLDGTVAKILQAAAILLALTYIVAYLLLVWQRLHYPFELEWIEGSMVDHVQRVMSGQALYVAPSMNFVPFNYMPLYYYVAAALAQWTGLSFVPLRLISIAASLGTTFLLCLFVRRASASWKAGIVASGLFLATFDVSGIWMDMGRVDSLLVFFCMSAVYLLRWHERPWAWLTSGVCLALAFFTKQVGLVVAIPLIVYAVWQYRARSLWLIGAFAMACGAMFVWMFAASGGWFWYYVFDQPAAHALPYVNLVKFLTRNLFRDLGIIGVATATTWALLSPRLERRDVRFYALTALGLAGAGFLPSLKQGAADNAHIPVQLAIILLFCWIWPIAMQAAVEKRWLRMTATLWFVCVAQFCALAYDPRDTLPSRENLAAGRQLVAEIRDYPGDVLVFCHGRYSVMAGKPSHVHATAFADLMDGGNAAAQDLLLADYRAALRERRYSAIILDHHDLPQYDPALFNASYRRARRIFDNEQALLPVTGARSQPEWIYEPIPQ